MIESQSLIHSNRSTCLSSPIPIGETGKSKAFVFLITTSVQTSGAKFPRRGHNGRMCHTNTKKTNARTLGKVNQGFGYFFAHNENSG